MRSSANLELTALRLRAQLIDPSDDEHYRTPAEVVRWMLAMQGQDFPGVRFSVGLRSPGATDARVEAAIASGEIVRSWPMRGTLHLVAAEDLDWMLRISEPRQATWSATRRAALGITAEHLKRAGDVAVDLLSGSRVIRRDLLLQAWDAAGLATTGGRGYHMLWNLAMARLIVFGPADGKHPTFTLLEEWVPSPRVLAGEEALAEFAGRYFRSHGPATTRDFAWWASLTLRDGRAGAAAAGLRVREFDGTDYYLGAEVDGTTARAARPRVHALPGFDEYLLGYQNRSAVLAPEFSNLIVPGNNGVFLPTVVVDGAVAATWKRTERASAVCVTLDPFEPLSVGASDGFARAVHGYGRFLGKPVEIAPERSTTERSTTERSTVDRATAD